MFAPPQKYRTTSNNRLPGTGPATAFLLSYHLENIACFGKRFVFLFERSVLRVSTEVLPNLPTYLAVPHLQQLRDWIHFPNFSPSAPTKKSSITFFHPIITSCFPTEDSLPKRLLSHGELVRRKCCWGKWWTCVVFPQVNGKAANIKTAPACKVPRVYNKKLEKQKLPFGPLPSNQKCLKKVPSGFSQVCPGYPFIQAVPGVPPRCPWVEM